MKRALLPFLAILSFSYSSWAENILLLTNSKSGETNVFRKGSFLVFKLNADNSIHEGYIRNILDSSILFDDAQVSLSQINILAGSTKAKAVAGKVVHAVGNTLLFAGTNVLDGGLYLVCSDYYYWPIAGALCVTGGCLAGMGYLFDWASYPFNHSTRVRNYRDWNVSIVHESEQVGKQKEGIQSPDITSTGTPPLHKNSDRKKKNKKYSGDDVYGD